MASTWRAHGGHTAGMQQSHGGHTADTWRSSHQLSTHFPSGPRCLSGRGLGKRGAAAEVLGISRSLPVGSSPVLLRRSVDAGLLSSHQLRALGTNTGGRGFKQEAPRLLTGPSSPRALSHRPPSPPPGFSGASLGRRHGAAPLPCQQEPDSRAPSALTRTPALQELIIAEILFQKGMLLIHERDKLTCTGSAGQQPRPQPAIPRPRRLSPPRHPPSQTRETAPSRKPS